MTTPRDAYAELRRLLAEARLDEDVSEELEHHFDALVRRSLEHGLSEEDAHAAALERFGDMDRILAETRQVDQRIRRRRAFGERLGDARRAVRHAARRLVRRPDFTVFALLTLALALGAFAALYTVLDRVALRPLAYDDADRLVWIDSQLTWSGVESAWGVSPGGYFDFRDHNRTFEALGAFSTGEASFVSDAGPVRVSSASITAGLVPVLGLRADIGRVFVSEDDLPGAASTVVLGHRFWQDQFGGDPAVVGSTIDLNGARAEVIGVLERGAALPDAQVDVLRTLGLDPAARPTNTHWLRVVGRIRADATLEAARADLARLTSAFIETLPTAYSATFVRDTGFRTRVIPLKERVLGDIGRTIWILFASAGLLLLIAVANITNLYLVRTESRRRDFAVRLALGAGRRHLAWQSLSETLLLAAAAGVAAVWIAHAGLGLLVASAPATLPRASEISVGGATVAFTIAVALVLGVVLGLVPLAYRAFGRAGELVREGAARAGVTAGRNRVRRAMLASQVALALVLLAGGGLMLRSLDRLRSTDPGFESRDVLSFETFVPGSRYGSFAEVTAFYRAFLERIEALPGVERAGATTRMPMVGGGFCASMFLEDRPPVDDVEPPCVEVGTVAPGIFEALDIPVQGRQPTWQEIQTGTAGVVITRALAGRLWPGENALGKGLRPNGWDPPFYRVVGVVDDHRSEGLDRPPLEAVLFPMQPIDGAPLWSPSNAMQVAVEAIGDPAALGPAIRDILRDLDPAVPLADMQGLGEAIAASPSVARASFLVLLLGIAAGLALLLSTIGMYGVVAQLVSERANEIAVRLALGARLHQVVGMVLGQSLKVALVGAVAGVGVALLSTRALRALLYEVAPGDPLTLVSATLILLLTVAAATWLAARRAGRVDPIHTLRAE